MPYAIFSGGLIPIADLKDSMGALDGSTHCFLTFSVTDTVYGTMTFQWSEVPFIDTNEAGGDEVNACVLSWGNLVKYLPEGAERQNQAVIRLAMNAKVCPIDQASQTFTVYELLQNVDMRDVPVTVYQWHAGATEQASVWKGYWGGVAGYSFSRNEGATVDIAMSSLERDSTDAIATIITRSAFANAPEGSIGLISPRGYGSLAMTTDSTNEDTGGDVLHPMALGYGGVGGLTLPTDEAIAATAISSRYRAAQNDGTAAAKTTALGALSLNTVGSWWVYDESVGAYAHVDNTGNNILSTTNSSAETSAVISNAPAVQFVIRPVTKHSSTAAGITDAQPPVDDDSTNYVTLTETNNVVAYDCPAISLPSGAEVQAVRVAVELWEDGTGSGNGVAVGLWNANTSTFWGGSTHYDSFTHAALTPYSKRHQYVTSGTGGAGAWGVWAAESANSTTTLPEFVRGQFMYIDTGTSNQRKPIVIRVQWDSTAASGATYRVYSVALIVQVVYPKVKIGERTITKPRRGFEGFEPPPDRIVGVEDILGVPSTAPGIQVIWNGEYQQDDGSGTITGTASALIQKAPDIARHLVQVIGGKSVNSTSGTLGNFVDARTETTAGDYSISPVFGPSEIFTRSGALAEIMSRVRWLKVYQEDGVYQCLIDHLNPHSSQVYRSTSEPVEIEPWDIIDGSLEIEELDSRKIVNKVTVNCGHSYGRNSPLGSVTYDHPLSQGYWGASQEVSVDEPWIRVADLATGAPQAATYLAKYLGSVQARPRLTVRVGLLQKFYDLRPGHVLQFSQKMEDVGIFCPAYRTGRLDELHPSSTASANFADDTTPTLMAAGGADREMYAGASYQFPSMTINVSSAGSYTASANPWQYYDGSAWQDLTNVSCSDGRAPNQALASTGTFTVSWDRPTITSWKKAELTFTSTTLGPVDWIRHKGVAVLSAASGSALATIPATWWGRLFIVRETNRRVGSAGYPYMEAVLEEVM